MIVNKELLNNLCSDAGEKRTQKARMYKSLGRVEIIDVEYKNDKNFELKAIVTGTDAYKTYISVNNGEIDDITCNCQDYYNHYGVCKHTLATIMTFAENEKYIEKLSKQDKKINNNNLQYRNFRQLVNTFYNEEIDEIDKDEKELKNKGTIHIEPKVIYDRFLGDIKVEFKIGNKRMYKIKNLSEFYTRMLEKENYKYGEKLQFVHTKEMFDEESQILLQFLLKYAEIIKYANSNSNSNYRYYGKALSETSILLGNSGIDDLFEILKNKEVEFQKDYSTQKILFADDNPKISFTLKKIEDDKYIISPNNILIIFYFL